MTHRQKALSGSSKGRFEVSGVGKPDPCLEQSCELLGRLNRLQPSRHSLSCLTLALAAWRARASSCSQSLGGERLAWGQEARGEREGNQMLFLSALQKPSWLQGMASRQEERPKRQLSANMPRGWLQPIDLLPLPKPGLSSAIQRRSPVSTEKPLNSTTFGSVPSLPRQGPVQSSSSSDSHSSA